jgi:hypothetical protein
MNLERVEPTPGSNRVAGCSNRLGVIGGPTHRQLEASWKAVGRQLEASRVSLCDYYFGPGMRWRAELLDLDCFGFE